MAAKKLMWIVWPAFLAACALELAVFAFADPLELHWGGQDLGWSRQGTYTAAFFVFWLISAGACTLTTMLCASAADINADQPGNRGD